MASKSQASVSSNLKPAGYVNVRSLEIRSFSDTGRGVDLVPNYTNIVINESIHSPYVHGYVEIIDSYGLIYKSVEKRKVADKFNFPHIRGEEFLRLTYQDDTTETVHQEEYFVYSVENIHLADNTKETALQYRLHFCSAPKLFSDTYVIRKAYRDMKISDMVQDIFKEYYIDKNPGTTKPIEIEETTGNYTFAIPALKPEQAIMFLARKAYSKDSKSSLFFFFETRDKFYFYSHEGFRKLFDRKEKDFNSTRTDANPNAVYNYFEYGNGIDDNTPDGQKRAKELVINASLSPVNTASHVKNQAYRRNVSEIDLLNRQIRKYSYEYKDFYSNFNNIDSIRLNNSQKFIDAISANEFVDSFAFKDYNGPLDNNESPSYKNHDRPYPYYVETMSSKPIFSHHFIENKMKGEITGRKLIKPGDIINFKIPEFTVTSMKSGNVNDIDNSGYQMITDITHHIAGNQWRSQISFTKAGKGGGPESQPDAPATPEARALSQFAQTPTATQSSGAGATIGPRQQGPGIPNRPGQGPVKGLQPITLAGAQNDAARQSAEEYLGREMSDTEWDYLVRATVAEAGTNAEERGKVMGVILNRVKSPGWGGNDVVSVLTADKQFEAVTGAGGRGASNNFLAPTQGQINGVLNAVPQYLNTTNPSHLNFTAVNLQAYREGTNPGFIDKVANDPSHEVIGGTIFGTARS